MSTPAAPEPPAAHCSGPGCKGKGVRVPVVLAPWVLACRICDGRHLFDPATRPKGTPS